MHLHNVVNKTDCYSMFYKKILFQSIYFKISHLTQVLLAVVYALYCIYYIWTQKRNTVVIEIKYTSLKVAFERGVVHQFIHSLRSVGPSFLLFYLSYSCAPWMNVFNCFKVGVNFITSGELCNSKLKDKKTFTHKNLCVLVMACNVNHTLWVR